MRDHIIGFDYLRVLAAFSVVWIHSCHTNILLADLNVINGYAVPVFVLLFSYLFGKKYDGKDFNKKGAILYLFKKVLPQYIFWTLIYLVLRFIKSLVLGADFSIDFFTLFLGASSVQLWFLPAILFWQLILIFYWNNNTNNIIDLILMVCLFSAGRYLMINDYLKEGFLNCFAIYSGYILAAKLIYQNYGILKKINPIIYLIISFLFLLAVQFFDLYSLVIFYSISVFLFFLFGDFQRLSLINSLSVNSFGIYLIHFVFIQFLIIGASFFKYDVSTISFTLFNLIASFGLSYLVSLMFKRSRYLKRVV